MIIVGGVAGGASAAARLRRLDEAAEIIIFERSGFISYANCGLPYYIGGVIGERSQLTLQTPESFWRRFRIKALVHHEVTAIDPRCKSVTVHDLAGGRIFEESYDKLVLSPGAKPSLPPLPGLASDKIFILRTVEDCFKIRDFVECRRPRSAVMVGGGFISLEVAENLCGLGLQLSIVQSGQQLLRPLDYEMAVFVHAELRQKGVDLKLSAAVESFANSEQGVQVFLQGQPPLKADMAVVAIGVSPETQLAQAAGLKLGLKGSIVVDEHMRSSEPDIYAVGDAVEVRHSVSGQRALIALAGPANKQGRVAADHICGLASCYKGSQGSSIIKVFDLTVGSTGLNELAAREAGLDCDKIYLSPGNQAGYYPGGQIMAMKLVFEKGTYRLLGAQIAGYKGVDKRLDVLATAIAAHLKATELKDLDLAYAPPYSSAKDPVNMAGFMVENIAQGLVKQWFWDELKSLEQKGGAIFLDTRTPHEYERGHIAGFINIPLDSLRQRLEELDKNKKIYLICHSGLRSYLASRILSQRGFDCYNFSGGYRLYAAVSEEWSLARKASECGADRL